MNFFPLYIAWLFRYFPGVMPVCFLKKRQKEEASSNPSFGDNNADTARQYKVAPNKENRAVSVCAVWNLSDTAERTLWRNAAALPTRSKCNGVTPR